jgi:hypothetical protein
VSQQGSKVARLLHLDHHKQWRHYYCAARSSYHYAASLCPLLPRPCVHHHRRSPRRPAIMPGAVLESTAHLLACVPARSCWRWRRWIAFIRRSLQKERQGINSPPGQWSCSVCRPRPVPFAVQRIALESDFFEKICKDSGICQTWYTTAIGKFSFPAKCR